MAGLGYQVAGLCIVIIVLVLFYSKTKLLFKADSTFLYLLISVVITILLDIGKRYGLYYSASASSLFFTYLEAKLSYISFVVVALLSHVYTEKVTEQHALQLNNSNAWKLAPLCVLAVAALVLPVHIVTRENVLYYSGAFVVASYLAALAYGVMSVVFLVKHKDTISQGTFHASLFFSLVLAVCIVLKLFYPHFYIISFGMAFAVLFTYIEMENPDDYVDRLTGSFNEYAFYERMRNYENGAAPNILLVILPSKAFLKERLSVQKYEKYIIALSQALMDLNVGRVYRMDSGEYVIELNHTDNIDKLLTKMRIAIQQIAEAIADVSDDYIWYAYVDQKQTPMNLTGDELRFFMQDVKKAEPNQFYIYDASIQEKRKEEMYIVASLKQAIEDKAVQVFYQPIYSTAKQRYTTAEALIRVKDLDGNYISPEIFIPIAEQQGLILTLGAMVFQNVCRFIHEEKLMEKGFDYVEINLSTVQCMQTGLAAQLVSIMKEYNISPNFINLEITETAAIQSEQILMKNMHRLIQLGATFSLDDYGSGYSNLDYVIRMPFYLVKLDKLLVWDSFVSEKSRILLKSSVEMFKRMQLKIVAEGVETKEQAVHLEDMGISYLQGYYFSKPVCEQEFLTLLEQQS